MSKELQFVKGVNALHAFYTENVRMLAHSYDLTDEEASQLLARFDFQNVARAILHPPRVDLFGSITGDFSQPEGDEGNK